MPPPPSSSPTPQASPPPPTADTSFYQRPLPAEICTAFDSDAGKALFKSALLTGGLEAFFPLSQQFLTQNEPAYCGLGTLCMILNALRVDPAQTWRKPWRWFTQEMLDCCRPLNWVREHGITLSEFSCLARCNGLDATTRFGDETGFDEFVADVRRCTQSADLLMAVSFSRAKLRQTGSGHFSPVGAYTEENGGMVLVLDVARFKFPSYWVPVRTLYEALIPHDPATGQSRGYALLRKRPAAPDATSSLLKLNATITTWPAIFAPLLELSTHASSYEDLVTRVSEVLSAPTGLPNVISRLEKQDLPPMSLFSAPEFDVAAAGQAKSDYQRSVRALHTHFAQRCELFGLLAAATDDMWRTEITVFMLAIFSMEKLVRRLAPPLAAEVRERVERDLRDERIRAEAELVRLQMESLERCRDEECGVGKCCGGDSCGPK